MKKSQLDRALELLRRTGDKFLIFDRQTEDVFALLHLNDYESLLSGSEPVENLSEREMLDRVNRELANWRAHREAEETDDFEPVLAEKEPLSIPETEAFDLAGPEIMSESPKMAKESQKTSQFSGSEETLADVPAEEEEEKFYLEPVE